MTRLKKKIGKMKIIIKIDKRDKTKDLSKSIREVINKRKNNNTHNSINSNNNLMNKNKKRNGYG